MAALHVNGGTTGVFFICTEHSQAYSKIRCILDTIYILKITMYFGRHCTEVAGFTDIFLQGLGRCIDTLATLGQF